MRTEKINFQDEQALSAFPVDPADLPQVLSDFGLRGGHPAIVLIGGKVEEELATITLEAIQTIARIAADLQAVVISGGTDMGIMAQIGDVRWRSQYQFPLIGVAPEAQVTWPDGPSSSKFLWWGRERWPLAKHYTHFILTPGNEFGDESPWIVDTATWVSQGHGSVTVLLNGGEISRRDIELSIDQGRPVVALSHTGRLADEIAKQPFRDKMINVIPANAVDQIGYVLRAILLMKERSEIPHSYHNAQ